MKIRTNTFCIIMLTIILMSTLSVAFDLKLVGAETGEKKGFDAFLKETNEVAPSSKNDIASPVETSDDPWYNIFQKNQGMGTTGGRSYNTFPNSEDKGEVNKTKGWDDFAFFDGNLTSIIVGIDNKEPNGYLQLEKLVSQYNGKIINTVATEGKIIAAVVGFSIHSVSAFMQNARAAEFTSYIEPNMKFQINLVPNDPYWSYQWAPAKIRADWAWNTTLGDPSIRVAVVDTGIDYNHEDLAANYVPLGYDWVNDDAYPMDDNGHGTHCAGIIAATINNSIGIAGLARVRIMAEKALDQYGEGYADWLANAIIHATDQGANIISMSWGDYSQSELIHEAIQYAYNAGVLLVAAAGNENTDLKLYPAAYDEVIAVTATNMYDERPGWSNFGDWVELAAPGVSIYSTVPGGYDHASGTSMAAPHVAGVAALAWSQFQNVTRDWLRLWLRYTVDDIGDPGFDIYYGYGRINARKAVEETLPEHELIIIGWKTPPYVKPGNSGIINATIFNFGKNDESDMEVQLLTNGTLVDSASISFLASGTSTTVSCSWSPTVAGLYNLTLYVVPVPGETSLENNVLWKYIYVGFPVKAVVLHSAGNIQGSIITNWQVLNSEWHCFGAAMVYIDYTTLNKDNLTYEDITTTEADVLIISCAYDPYAGWQFTDSEIEAIKRYVLEGHGLIATAGTLYNWVPNNNKLAPLFGLNETTMWTSTGTDLLHLVNATHPIFTNVPNPLVFPQVGTALPYDGRWDSNELWDGKYLALGHYQESAIVMCRGLVYISPWLEVIPPYYHHHLQLLYNAITWSTYQKPEHELVVSLECPAYLEPAESALLNATVVNRGLNNETNVALFLYIDGLEVNSTTVPKLVVDSSYTIEYLWTPVIEKTYNVTSFAPPLPDEEITFNNVESSIVNVRICLGEILYDESHDNRNFLDPTDPINHGDAWGYTTWAKIVTEAGYRITKWLPGDGELTLPILSHYDILVISMARESFTVSEISAIQTWVHLGGSLFLVGEADNYAGDPARFNPVITEFGMEFDLYGEIYEHVISDLAVHPITRGLSQYEVAYCGVLILSPPAQWLGRNGTGRVTLACSEYGSGRVVVAADTNTFADNYGFQDPLSPIYEHSKTLSLNILDWLLPQEHDLAVSLDAPSFLALGTSLLLNATVTNRGLNNETDVELFLMVNGSIVNSTTIPELLTSHSHTITYLWIPALEGAYNVTAYGSPVPYEKVIANNQAAKFVAVAYPLIRPIEGQYANYTISQIDINTGTITGTGMWNFTYFRYISPYQINITMLMIDPSGYTQSGWMIVNIMNRMVERDSGIYWVGMWYPGWIETNVTIGSTINLLDSAVTIVDSEIIFVGIRLIDCWKIRLVQYEYIYAFWYDKASGLWTGMEAAGPYTMRMVLAETNIPIGFKHDLAVMLDAPLYLEPSETTILNATVYNTGLSNETGVELQILINDTSVSSTVIPELMNYSSEILSYLWKPTVEGVYNVTAYAPPVLGENFTLNNAKSAIIHVQILPDIVIVNDNNGDSWINGTSLSEFEMALTTAGYDCFVWNESSMGNPPLDFLTKFKLVIWTCGDYWDWAVDPVDAATLESYLVQGGNILLEGEDIGYDHGADLSLIHI